MCTLVRPFRRFYTICIYLSKKKKKKKIGDICGCFVVVDEDIALMSNLTLGQDLGASYWESFAQLVASDSGKLQLLLTIVVGSSIGFFGLSSRRRRVCEPNMQGNGGVGDFSHASGGRGSWL